MSIPTEAELQAMVRNDDPAAFRWFGALLERTVYAPARRTDEQEATNAAIKATWPKFEIVGRSNDVKKACLWDCVKARTGSQWLPFFQETGSCVGNGGGCAVNYTSAVEAWVKGEPEEVKHPTFFLYPYGRSRVYANLGGPGEGSFGSAFAQAIKDDGIFESTLEGLPKWTERNGGITWGASQEKGWSWSPDGSALHKKWSEVAHKHPIQTVAQCKNADDVRAALTNGYGCTCASMWGGKMECPVTSDPPVLLNSKTGSWAHQMALLSWWEHPKLGEIFWIQNSWGSGAHGTDPSGGPPGGFWVKKADVDWICKDEVFAFSNFNGFPAKTIDWSGIFN